MHSPSLGNLQLCVNHSLNLKTSQTTFLILVYRALESGLFLCTPRSPALHAGEIPGASQKCRPPGPLLLGTQDQDPHFHKPPRAGVGTFKLEKHRPGAEVLKVRLLDHQRQHHLLEAVRREILGPPAVPAELGFSNSSASAAPGPFGRALPLGATPRVSDSVC